MDYSPDVTYLREDRFGCICYRRVDQTAPERDSTTDSGLEQVVPECDYHELSLSST